MSAFEIVIWDEEARRWDPYLAGPPADNRFATQDEAERAAESLRGTRGFTACRIGYRAIGSERSGNAAVEEVTP